MMPFVRAVVVTAVAAMCVALEPGGVQGAPPTTEAQAPVPRSGFDPASFDRTVQPSEDLYRFVNGRWLASTVIAPDRSVENATSELFDKVERDVHAIIERLAAQPGRRSGSSQKIVDLYASVVNEPLLNRVGASPLKPELDAIDAIDAPRGVAERAGVLSATTTAGPFFASIGVNPLNPTEQVVQLSQGGLLLEQADYLREDERSRDIRAKYRGYLAELFQLLGRPNAETDAAAVLELEIAIARAYTPPGVTASNLIPRVFRLPAMANEFHGFDWAAWAHPQGIDRGLGVLVMQPQFFRLFAAMVPTVPLSTWRAWLVGRYATAMAPYLSEPIGDARYRFFGRVLGGQPEPRPRWKRGVSTVNVLLADAIGRLYLEGQDLKAARSRVERIANEVIRASREAVAEFDWPRNVNRLEARSRMATLAARVGGPSVWRDYGSLVIKPDDLFGNFMRSQKFENDRRMARGGAPAAAGEWPLGPQTVNAFYNAATNEVMVPAAILQPPYFDVAADDAVNYGAIGAVIGHEIGHALDGLGRRIPAGSSAEQLNDATGLAMAYAAYKRSLGSKPAPVIDGLSGDQRFFLGWARIWRELVRPEYARQLAISNPYPAGAARANAPLRQIAAFPAAFPIR